MKIQFTIFLYNFLINSISFIIFSLFAVCFSNFIPVFWESIYPEVENHFIEFKRWASSLLQSDSLFNFSGKYTRRFNAWNTYVAMCIWEHFFEFLNLIVTLIITLIKLYRNPTTSDKNVSFTYLFLVYLGDFL